jgi:RecA-family ATPase
MLPIKLPTELEDRSSQPWLIHGLIPKNACCLISGNPKTRKSWFVAEIMVSIATQTDAFGTFPTDKGQGGILMIQGEDSQTIIKERLEKIARVRGAGLHALNDSIAIVADHPFALDKDEDFQMLECYLKEKRPSVVVLDPLKRLIPNTDEGSSARMGPLLSKLRQLQRDSGTTIILVHHNKSTQSKDRAANIRGTTDLRSWYDAAFFLTKPVESVTQVGTEYKGFEGRPDFFFELREKEGGLAPMGLVDFTMPEKKKEIA